MTYRMIAIDLDGTLLGPDGDVTPRTRGAVHAVLRAGLFVCFATGRNYTESRTVLDAVAHYDSAVFAGGAMVIDTREHLTLHRTIMQPALARQISAWLEDSGHCVLALQDRATAGIDYLVSDAVEMNGETRLWMERTRSRLQHVNNLRDHIHEHTIRLGIVADPNVVNEVQSQLRIEFNERILCQNLAVTAANVNVLEIFDPAVNKWQGILHVARRHGVAAEEIVAIGDDVNDLPMLANAGLGVAMGNARPEVKAVAKRVINRNDQDGLAEFLEELLAGHAVEPISAPSLETA